MDRREKIRKLIGLLLEEEPEYRQQAAQFPQDMESQRRMLRSLINVRYPGKRLNPEYLRLQDELCFIPCHACIDNAIHSAAGLQLREECMGLMREQGFEEPVGRAKITKG